MSRETQFKLGNREQSRPSRRPISQRLISKLHEQCRLPKLDAEGKPKLDKLGRPIYENVGMTNLEKIVDNIVDRAVQGEDKMMDMLMDRTEGRPHQSVAFEDQDGVPQQMPSVVFSFVGDTSDDENPVEPKPKKK